MVDTILNQGLGGLIAQPASWLLLVVLIITLAARWKIYGKVGLHGIEALLPVWNNVVLTLTIWNGILALLLTALYIASISLVALAYIQTKQSMLGYATAIGCVIWLIESTVWAKTAKGFNKNLIYCILMFIPGISYILQWDLGFRRNMYLRNLKELKGMGIDASEIAPMSGAYGQSKYNTHPEHIPREVLSMEGMPTTGFIDAPGQVIKQNTRTLNKEWSGYNTQPQEENKGVQQPQTTADMYNQQPKLQPRQKPMVQESAVEESSYESGTPKGMFKQPEPEPEPVKEIKPQPEQEAAKSMFRQPAPEPKLKEEEVKPEPVPATGHQVVMTDAEYEEYQMYLAFKKRAEEEKKAKARAKPQAPKPEPVYQSKSEPVYQSKSEPVQQSRPMPTYQSMQTSRPKPEPEPAPALEQQGMPQQKAKPTYSSMDFLNEFTGSRTVPTYKQPETQSNEELKPYKPFRADHAFDWRSFE